LDNQIKQLIGKYGEEIKRAVKSATQHVKEETTLTLSFITEPNTLSIITMKIASFLIIKNHL